MHLRFSIAAAFVLSAAPALFAQKAGPVQPEEPAYKAVAVLDRPDVDANGQKVPLQAGMLLKAEVILDRRSLADWILDPLLHKRM